MKLSVELKISAGFGLAFLVLTLVDLVAYQSTIQLSKTNQLVTHTYIVLDSLETILSSITTLETSARGYIITGNPRFLAANPTMQESIQRYSQALQTLTANNPLQQERLTRLNQLLAEKQVLIEETLRARRERGFATAQQLMLTGKGLALMDAIRALVAEMKETELGLLNQREDTSRISNRQVLFIIGIGSALGLSLVALASILVIRHLKARRRSEERLSASHDVARMLAEAATVEEASARLLEIIGRHLGWEVSELWRVDSRSGSIHLAAHWQDATAAVAEAKETTQRTSGVRREVLPDRVWASGQAA